MLTFSENVYTSRREKLFTLIHTGIGIFFSNEMLPMNYPSNTFPFRPNSSFLYFFGIPLPSIIGMIDFDEKKVMLFGDDVDIEDIIWMGKLPTLKELGSLSGVEQVYPLDKAEEFLKKVISQKRFVHFLPPYQYPQQSYLSSLLNIPINEVKKLASSELIKAVVACRSVKSNEEIQELKKAADIGYRMHLEAFRRAVTGTSEQEIAGILEGIAWAYGKGPSFPIILTQRGEILHNHHHDQLLQDGRLLLIDAGAQANSYYASDYTRVIPVNGRFSDRQKEIYQIVLNALNHAISLIRPGKYYRDIHLEACKIIAKGLKDLHLLKGDVDEIVEAGAHALFFPHGLGHMIGLDVHDMEDLGENFVGYDETIQRSHQFGLAYLRLARQLQEGFTLTVEPGIYFIPPLIEKWEQEKKFKDFIVYDEVKKWIGFGGIRLEDDVVVTPNGCEHIGKRLPIIIEEIENIL
ncbi:MAG: aminopeptidase P family protein [Bacteroidales bacterium]|nr:aminopeptidase P family protein [Bacteroidales bacterium]